MKRVVVTGASGFIGNRLCRLLANDGYIVRAVYREPPVQNNTYEQAIVGEINQDTQWEEALRDVDFVIHLAARVHVMKEMDDDPLAKFRDVNLYGTINLARQASILGVKRFIYISSIKVNGEGTSEKPFTASDIPSPSDPYAISKSEAEKELMGISQETGLETVVIRPPLVYGPGVRGNFFRLLNLTYRKIPLPLASIENRRSMISLDNLCHLLINCLENPNATGKTFLVSDGEDLSTPELIRKLAKYMDLPDRLFKNPIWLLKLAGVLTGKTKEVDRLCGSLVIDMQDTRECLNWDPPQSQDEGIQQTVNWYLNKIGRQD